MLMGKANEGRGRLSTKSFQEQSSFKERNPGDTYFHRMRAREESAEFKKRFKAWSLLLTMQERVID